MFANTLEGGGESERLFCSQKPDITRFLDCALKRLTEILKPIWLH
jgi:hypothetical protein